MVYVIDIQREMELERMLGKQITGLSRFIGRKWYLTLEELSKQSKVPYGTIKRAVSGRTIYPAYEQRLRDFLEKL